MTRLFPTCTGTYNDQSVEISFSTTFHPQVLKARLKYKARTSVLSVSGSWSAPAVLLIEIGGIRAPYIATSVLADLLGTQVRHLDSHFGFGPGARKKYTRLDIDYLDAVTRYNGTGEDARSQKSKARSEVIQAFAKAVATIVAAEFNRQRANGATDIPETSIEIHEPTDADLIEDTDGTIGTLKFSGWTNGEPTYVATYVVESDPEGYSRHNRRVTILHSDLDNYNVA